MTNLTGAPRTVYEQVYCQRGDMENRLKELGAPRRAAPARNLPVALDVAAPRARGRRDP